MNIVALLEEDEQVLVNIYTHLLSMWSTSRCVITLDITNALYIIVSVS